jgi:hypothetical protein
MKEKNDEINHQLIQLQKLETDAKLEQIMQENKVMKEEINHLQ